jgi:hypothetical protein
VEVRAGQQQPYIGMVGFGLDDRLQHPRGTDGIAGIEEHRRPAVLLQQVVHRAQSTQRAIGLPDERDHRASGVSIVSARLAWGMFRRR